LNRCALPFDSLALKIICNKTRSLLERHTVLSEPVSLPNKQKIRSSNGASQHYPKGQEEGERDADSHGGS